MVTTDIDTSVDVAAIGKALGKDEGPGVDTQDPLLRYSREVDRDGVKAMIRVPNQHQQDRVRKKSIAARTRAVRECRDEFSDAYLNIESMSEPMHEHDDDTLRTFLLSQHMDECMAQASIFITTADEDTHPQYAEFHSIDEQIIIYNHHLSSDDDGDSDEMVAAENILTDYSGVLKEVTREMLEPFELKYDAMDREKVLESVFRHFAKQHCDKAFLDTYNEWTMFFGTRKADNHSKTYWDSYEDMVDESLEVIEVISSEFNALHQGVGDPKK